MPPPLRAVVCGEVRSKSPLSPSRSGYPSRCLLLLPLTGCCYSPRAAAYGANQRYAKIESSPATHKTTLGFPVQIGGVSGSGLSAGDKTDSPDALPPHHYPGGALGLPMDLAQ